MALLWAKNIAGVQYEVRAAGRTRRLYTDGVFHSQYNPQNLITGGVWDLLMLPAFLLPPHAVQRVLLLGVGGGTVIHQLRHYLRPREIVAVELNRTHLDIAAKYFDIDADNVELVEADGREWVKNYRGRKFDLVIDDLFGECDGEPCRAIDLDDEWLGLLERLTSRQGALAINTLGPAAARDAAERLANSFPGALQLRAPMDENAVAALFREPVEARQLRRNLMAVPGLNPQRKSNSLRFECRSL